MTKKMTKAQAEYNRIGEKVIANRNAMRTASADEKRRLITENHELMTKMDTLL